MKKMIDLTFTMFKRVIVKVPNSAIQTFLMTHLKVNESQIKNCLPELIFEQKPSLS